MSNLVIGLIILFFVVIFIVVIGIVLSSGAEEDPEEDPIDVCEGCENCANCSISSVCIDPVTGDPMIKQSECISGGGEVCEICEECFACDSCCPTCPTCPVCNCTEYVPITEGNYYPTKFFAGKDGGYDNSYISSVTLAKNTAKVGDVVIVTGNYLWKVKDENYAFKSTSTGLLYSAVKKGTDYFYLNIYLIVPDIPEGEYTITLDYDSNNNGFKPATINIVSEYSNLDIPYDQFVDQERDHGYTGSASFFQQVGRKNDLVMLSGNKMSNIKGGKLDEIIILFINNETGVVYTATSNTNVNYSFTSIFVFIPNDIIPGNYQVEPKDYPFINQKDGEESVTRFEIIE